MIQLLDLMILMVGCYIITRMTAYLFRDIKDAGNLGAIIIKLLAVGTIIITIVCVAVAMLSFVQSFDLTEFQY